MYCQNCGLEMGLIPSGDNSANFRSVLFAEYEKQPWHDWCDLELSTGDKKILHRLNKLITIVRRTLLSLPPLKGDQK